MKFMVIAFLLISCGRTDLPLDEERGPDSLLLIPGDNPGFGEADDVCCDRCPLYRDLQEVCEERCVSCEA